MAANTSWYALRLKPGAARPYRNDARLTNIEWSMTQEGLSCYMPMELVLKIHHRTKKPIDKRFPIIPGYAFMEAGPGQNWEKVRDCDFVASIIGSAGRPLPIPLEWIVLVKQWEDQWLKSYEYKKMLKAMEEERRTQKVTRRSVSEQFPAGSVVMIGDRHRLFAGHKATVVDATGRNTIKAVIETLNGMANAEIPIELVEMAS